MVPLTVRKAILQPVQSCAKEELAMQVVEEIMGLSMSEFPFIPLKTCIACCLSNNCRWEQELDIAGLYRVTAPLLIFLGP
jgi:hypothetical protein